MAFSGGVHYRDESWTHRGPDCCSLFLGMRYAMLFGILEGTKQDHDPETGITEITIIEHSTAIHDFRNAKGDFICNGMNEWRKIRSRRWTPTNASPLVL
jgi:hypothetical protein